jgi:hypothetical protein
MNASRPRGWRFKVARLAELDMAFLGPRVIVAELRSESPAPSRWALRRLFTSSAWGGAPWSWPTLLGIELVAIGMSYLPLLFEAWRILTRQAMAHRIRLVCGLALKRTKSAT